MKKKSTNKGKQKNKTPDYYNLLTEEEIKMLSNKTDDEDKENKDKKEDTPSEESSSDNRENLEKETTVDDSPKQEETVAEVVEPDEEIQEYKREDVKDEKKEIEKEQETLDDIKPKSGGIMSKIHNMLSLDSRIENTKEKIINRDPVTWHRILMAIVISYIGIFVIMSFIYDALMESHIREYTDKLYLGNVNGEFKLPDGEYKIIGLNPSKLNPKNPSQRILAEGDNVILVAKTGGVLLYTNAPSEIELPKEFYDPRCFDIKIINGDEWEFLPTDYLDKMRDEMKKRQEMMEKYKIDMEKQQNEAKQQTTNQQAAPKK